MILRQRFGEILGINSESIGDLPRRAIAADSSGLFAILRTAGQLRDLLDGIHTRGPIFLILVAGHSRQLANSVINFPQAPDSGCKRFGQPTQKPPES